jgi:hypothetical protein
MAHSADGPFDVQRLIDQDEVDTLFATANPNPKRFGCLSKTTLAALARRERDLDDPGYQHLTQCSECYREFRSLREPGRGQASGGRSVPWWLSVAAAVLLVAAGAWLYRGRQASAPAESTPAFAAQSVELDLRPYSASRSEQGSDARPPLALRRDNLELTLQLPTGAEPGTYETRLLDASSRVLASGTGRAQIQNFVTTLQVSLDLRSISTGAVRLMVRREGDDWHAYPAVVR